MTRINLINARLLADQHLIAEIKEINQLAGSFRKSLSAKKGIFGIPDKFTLNTGHVKFFYNKALYLHKRFNDLKSEAIRREFNIEAEFQNEWVSREDLYNDWVPEKEDIQLVVDRIILRVNETPKVTKIDGWYRYKKNTISNFDYLKLLKENHI